jgi:hypothetical protein
MASERTSLLAVLLLLAATVHHSTCQLTSGDPEDHAALAKVSVEEFARARRSPKSHRRDTISATGSDVHNMCYCPIVKNF